MLDIDTQGLWIFGYGSLIWKPNFPFIQKKPAILTGWVRRFYQASPDHRGTKVCPGRVVTLLPDPTEKCYGMAYQIANTHREKVLNYLDIREQKGYSLLTEQIVLLGVGSVPALVYIAATDNPHYIGPESPKDIAAQITKCTGPSGSNLEYFLQLRTALQKFSPSEKHLDDIFQHLHQ